VIPILLYHAIASDCDPSFAEWAVDPALFAAHMDHLAERGWSALTVSELAARLFDRRGPLPERPVAITFDDGFRDFLTAAWPAMRRHALTGTVFVTTGSVGGTSTWLSGAGEGERPMLSWSEIARLKQSGVEFGAHGHAHLQLDTVAPTVAWSDILASKLALADVIGPVAAFAYPHGYYTRTLQRQVAEAGFASACAVRDGMSGAGDDRYALARIVVRGGTDVETFERMLSGEGRGMPSPRPLRRGAWRVLRTCGAESIVRRVARR
jgi:peptidoglycan/xylan/chitin deacetylase (PgdA/CDA1 family)